MNPMTPSEMRGTITQIIDGLEQQRTQMFLTAGSDHMTRPVTLAFDPTECSYDQMRTILDEVRSRFPQWTIKGEWKTR